MHCSCRGFVSDSLDVYRLFLWMQTWIYIDLECILVAGLLCASWK